MSCIMCFCLCSNNAGTSHAPHRAFLSINHFHFKHIALPPHSAYIFTISCHMQHTSDVHPFWHITVTYRSLKSKTYTSILWPPSTSLTHRQNMQPGLLTLKYTTQVSIICIPCLAVSQNVVSNNMGGLSVSYALNIGQHYIYMCPTFKNCMGFSYLTIYLKIQQKSVYFIHSGQK